MAVKGFSFLKGRKKEPEARPAGAVPGAPAVDAKAPAEAASGETADAPADEQEESSGHEEQLLQVIEDQLKELHDTLNDKVAALEKKVNDAAKQSSGDIDMVSLQEKFKSIDKIEASLEKFTRLYELITNKFNPFVDEQTNGHSSANHSAEQRQQASAAPPQEGIHVPGNNASGAGGSTGTASISIEDSITKQTQEAAITAHSAQRSEEFVRGAKDLLGGSPQKAHPVEHTSEEIAIPKLEDAIASLHAKEISGPTASVEPVVAGVAGNPDIDKASRTAPDADEGSETSIATAADNLTADTPKSAPQPISVMPEIPRVLQDQDTPRNPSTTVNTSGASEIMESMTSNQTMIGRAGDLRPKESLTSQSTTSNETGAPSGMPPAPQATTQPMPITAAAVQVPTPPVFGQPTTVAAGAAANPASDNETLTRLLAKLPEEERNALLDRTMQELRQQEAVAKELQLLLPRLPAEQQKRFIQELLLLLHETSQEHAFWTVNGTCVRNVLELAQCIQSLDEATYQGHQQHGDFSSWVSNSLHLPGLGRALESTTTRQAALLAINNRSTLVLQVLQGQNPWANATSIVDLSVPRQQQQEFLRQVMRLLEEAAPERAFWTCDRICVRNLLELAHGLGSMRPEAFQHHVTGQRNDFSLWVGGVLAMPDLAQSIAGARDAAHMLQMLAQDMSLLRGML
ncbi:hypothetical protein AUJ68_00190 [Candidatus Woesearchaeota archaeon CG1_02_57_44]|nr:MAG: hypothetical protein AUJ68_00190 [Candidatus Woesearchaeota archaeon CG1_02_57_44]